MEDTILHPTLNAAHASEASFVAPTMGYQGERARALPRSISTTHRFVVSAALEFAIMGAVKIDPMKLPGPWAEGWVLERQHTLSAEFLGHDSFGNPQFDTKRSELGELVFRLKNRNDKNTLDPIADTAVQFIEGWNSTFDLVVPVPPSRKRAYQPVVEIAKAISGWLSVPVNEAAVAKIRDTPELKDVFDYRERIKLLEGAFQVDPGAARGKRILLVDDLYRSGATATVVAQALLSGGAATCTCSQ